jgi:hypothetical protein
VNGCSTELTESIEIMGLKNNLPKPIFVINFSLTFRSDMLNLCIRRPLKRMQPNQIKSQFEKHENKEISNPTMKKKQQG